MLISVDNCMNLCYVNNNKNPYIVYVCKLYVFIFLIPGIGSFKKRWLKPQDSNLAQINYVSGILPLQRTLFEKHKVI